MPGASVFTDNVSHTSFWWRDSQTKFGAADPLPDKTDVLIIGSGYTGLHAAIETARAGLQTTVIDAKQIGWGCSTRNGGQVSTSVKPGFGSLTRRHGKPVAEEILREGQASRDFIEAFVERHGIACEFKVTGRFHGAHSPRQYEKQARACDEIETPFKTEAYTVPKAEQHKELATDFYHGGVVFPNHASIDPDLYHAGLARVAEDAGASLIPQCGATAIRGDAGRHEVSTEKGMISAKTVIVATNGYGGALLPWLQRRIIPIGSYIIGTEEIPQTLFDRLFPTDRILSDTRKLVYYYRPSPDRKRVLFGGRVSLRETDPQKSAPLLHRDMVRIFPELSDVRVDHTWHGIVGYTFDSLMHAGQHDGVYWAGGYCGSGIGMASYLGNIIGRQAAGDPSARTVFAKIPFPTRPYFRGNPWFLTPSILYYRIMDAIS